MQVGGAHVQVLVMMTMRRGTVVCVLRLVFMSVPMVVTAQPPGAQQVYCQAHHGDHDRLVVMNGLRAHQPFDRLPGHQ